MDVGFSMRPGRAAMIPEESVTMRKECYCVGEVNMDIHLSRCNTHQHLEEEESRHQTELEPSVLGNAFETGKEAKDDRKKHHQNGEQDWRQNTLLTIPVSDPILTS